MPVMAWGPILLAAYYAWFAVRVVKARRPGTILPQYQPPEGLSPAAIRYALISGTDGKTIAAALADLARIGLITLTRTSRGFEVKRTAAATPANLPHEEQVLLDLVFAYGDPNLIDPGNSPRMDGLVSGVQGALMKQYEGVFSNAGFGKIALGVLLSLGWGLGNAFLPGAGANQAFATVWGLGFTLVLFAVLWVRVLPAWNDVLHGRLHGRALAVVVFLMPIPLAMAGVAWFALSKMVTREFAVTLLALSVINVIGGSRLRAPTPHGRKVLDEIAGYRQFLLTTDQDRLNRLNAPGQAARVDAPMAYAIALDIKEGWGDDLCDTFMAATVSKG